MAPLPTTPAERLQIALAALGASLEDLATHAAGPEADEAERARSLLVWETWSRSGPLGISAEAIQRAAEFLWVAPDFLTRYGR